MEDRNKKERRGRGKSGDGEGETMKKRKGIWVKKSLEIQIDSFAKGNTQNYDYRPYCRKIVQQEEMQVLLTWDNFCPSSASLPNLRQLLPNLRALCSSSSGTMAEARVKWWHVSKNANVRTVFWILNVVMKSVNL